MIGHRPISTSQHHPGAQRRQLRTGAIEAEQGQRGHGGRKPGKGMNFATSPQNECENRRRRPSRGFPSLARTSVNLRRTWYLGRRSRSDNRARRNGDATPATPACLCNVNLTVPSVLLEQVDDSGLVVTLDPTSHGDDQQRPRFCRRAHDGAF